MVPQNIHQLRLPGLGKESRPPAVPTRPVQKMPVPSGKVNSPTIYKTTLEGRTIPFTVKRSKKARLVRLEITPRTGLTVVVPVLCSKERILRFIKDKSCWILNKLTRYDTDTYRKTSGMRDGDLIPYLGCFLKIEVRDSNGRGENVTLAQNTLVVAVRPGTKEIDPVIEKWFRIQAGHILREKVDRQSKRMVVDYNKIRLKGQKTVWGSCSRKNNLNFNWRLLMTPEPVIDYIVIHELSHLKEMNHTKKFWQVVAWYCPEWQQHRKWLKEHTVELNNILRV